MSEKDYDYIFLVYDCDDKEFFVEELGDGNVMFMGVRVILDLIFLKKVEFFYYYVNLRFYDFF